ncbi:MAG: sulfotransferase domain-containing protein [Leptospirillia bacterium]
MAVVWLSSYPRSGNTWLRFLLYSYLKGEAKHGEDVHRLIPDIHKIPRNELIDRGDLTLFKTHLMAGPNHPLMKRTKGFINVVRHPKDVLISSLNFMKTTGQFSGTDREFAESFIKSMGVPVWMNVGFGNWTGHVASWMAAAQRFPHAFLRYERLKLNPVDELRAAVRVLGVEMDEVRLEQAVEAASFENMRKLEAREASEGVKSTVFALREGSGRTRRHVHQGQTGQRLETLGEGLDEEFDRRFEAVLSLLGYPV